MALKYLQMSSRVQTVASRLESMQKMNTVSKGIAKVTRSVGTVMKSMDVEKISRVMEQFEGQMEDMDVRAGVMEDSMAQGTATMTPAGEVDELVSQLAAEAGLELQGEMMAAGSVPNRESSSISFVL